MSEQLVATKTHEPDSLLQERILALGQAALEGSRPLSDLLGEAFQELRSAAKRVREQEVEIRRKDERIVELQREADATSQRPWNGASSAEVTAREVRVPRVVEPAASPNAPPAALGRSLRSEEAAGLEASLRTRIASARYLGTLSAGDRLPSIREVARSTGLNHKVVRRVYRALERSGVAEVRDRSGTYVPEAEAVETLSLDPLQSWTVDILMGAVEQGLAVGDLPGLFERLSGARGLKCYCVESTEDDRLGLCEELRQSLGLETVPVGIGPDGLEMGISDADVVVTTPFHMDEVRAALAPGQPLVVASLHPTVSRTLRETLERASSPTRVVCVDRASGERLLGDLDPDVARRAHVVTVDRLTDGGDPGPTDIVTRAAWMRLGGGGDGPPYLSPRTTERVAKLLVRLTSK